MRAFLNSACAAAILLAAQLAASAASAQPTVDQLSKPPADAERFVIASKSATLGHSAIWRLPDGTMRVRDSLNLRGQMFESDDTIRIGTAHVPVTVDIRGFTPSGDAAESFSVANGEATWKSKVDEGHAPFATPALYVPLGGGFLLSPALAAEALAAAPDHTLALLPGGRAHAERLRTFDIGEGASKQTIVLWEIVGLGSIYGTGPVPVWTTQDGKFFAWLALFSMLPEQYQGSLARLEEVQDAAMAARSPILARTLAKTPTEPVAFTHVRAFVGDRFVDDETVVVEGDKIVSVGPAASTPAPVGAQLIDGAGKTLVPGLWDSHQHIIDDSSGPLLLSLGVTSARDPGNDNELTLSRAARRAKGELLMPHVYPSSLIDGKGPYTAQVGTSVATLDEALAAVRWAKAHGLVAIKIYGSFHPDWVKPTAALAHQLGLHVHGHLPAGMRPSQAIAAGYDEITHVYFLAMEAMPDDVVNTSNGNSRFSGPAMYAKDIDFDAEPMKSYIAEMGAKHIVGDPTLVVVEGMYTGTNGELAAVVKPYEGILPPAVERGFREGARAPAPGYTAEDYRKSFRKLMELVERLHRAGAPIVAGTDGSGIELVHELELYVQAGFTPVEALDAATIVAARNVHADKITGTIEVGKNADLLLVEGDPSRNIGDLRNTRIVMMDGKLMDADALRTASGISGRPKMAR
ncbi:MAG TPA: amidohydrolase family protein [Caulobacteraceae bacterium]|jgi:imidazolonepropionase-like amidohydrolase|nr:amidohydrolase family protein [Caulobacteraceae bacterium]